MTRDWMTRWALGAAGLCVLGLTACKTTETPAMETTQPTDSEFHETALPAADTGNTIHQRISGARTKVE